jgi:PAS domain S-box-containing protein
MSFEKPEPDHIVELTSGNFCHLLPPGSTLQDNLHFMHKILDAFPFPVFVKNSIREYLACNLAFEEYMGLRREEILGKTAYECGHEGLDYTRGETATDMFAGRGMRTDEITIVTADGTRRDVICNKYVFLNQDGTAGGIIGSIFDITGHKQTKGLLENLRFLQTLIDTIPCPIFYKDTNGVYRLLQVLVAHP